MILQHMKRLVPVEYNKLEKYTRIWNQSFFIYLFYLAYDIYH